MAESIKRLLREIAVVKENELNATKKVQIPFERLQNLKRCKSLKLWWISDNQFEKVIWQFSIIIFLLVIFFEFHNAFPFICGEICWFYVGLVNTELWCPFLDFNKNSIHSILTQHLRDSGQLFVGRNSFYYSTFIHMPSLSKTNTEALLAAFVIGNKSW